MPYRIIRGKLSSVTADAIVYADTPQPFAMFSFDQDLHFGKGREIRKTREALNPIVMGEAKITTCSELDAQYIIHTSAPAWHNGLYNEKRLLYSCYEKSFRLALEHDCKSIAIPVIAYQALGYPKKITEQAVFDCILEFLRSHDMMISIVLPEKTVLMRTMKPYSDVRKHIETHYVEGNCDNLSANSPEKIQAFSKILSEWITKKNLSHQDLCLDANISPRVLSDILSGTADSLSKHHAIALSIGLKLTLSEMKELLQTAGFELSLHSRFDLIVEHYISKKVYDLSEINAMLFRFEQPVVGC